MSLCSLQSNSAAFAKSVLYIDSLRELELTEKKAYSRLYDCQVSSIFHNLFKADRLQDLNLEKSQLFSHRLLLVLGLLKRSRMVYGRGQQSLVSTESWPKRYVRCLITFMYQSSMVISVATFNDLVRQLAKHETDWVFSIDETVSLCFRKAQITQSITSCSGDP